MEKTERVYKFRAWCHIRKGMWYPNNIPQGVYGCYLGESTLMQFTGLHDRKGIEIYEGDIIKGVDYHKGGEFVDDVIGVVKYEGLSFAIDGKQINKKERWFYTMTSPCKQDNAIEIIGNLYETPELLKEV